MRHLRTLALSTEVDKERDRSSFPPNRIHPGLHADPVDALGVQDGDDGRSSITCG